MRRRALGALCLAWGLLACQPSAEPPPPLPPAPSSEDEPEAVEMPEIEDDLHEGPLDPRDPQERVADAINVGRAAMGRALYEQIPEVAEPEGATTSLRLWVGGNTEGSLEVCGCRRNPLGGLARRATLIREDIDAPVFHVDAGNLLFERRADLDNVADLDDSPREIIATTLAEGLMHIGVDAVGIGANDLVLGGRFLRALEDETDLPLLSANLTADGAPLGAPLRVVERGGVTVAFVGVTSTSIFTEREWQTLGVSASAPLEAAAATIQEARAADPDVVVLVSSMGLTHTGPLVEALSYRDAAPDLVVVSNTYRMLRDPVWAAGIPMYEVGIDGKHALRLDLDLAQDTAIQFRPRNALSEDAMTYVRTTRMIGIALANRGRMDRRGDRPAQVARYDEELRGYFARLDETARLIQATLATRPLDAPAQPLSRIDAALEPVRPDIEEARDVRRLIDDAYDDITRAFGAAALPETAPPR